MKIQPPRALWVPFELGRPMGPPGNTGFQQQVLLSALSMVAENTDRAMLRDFDHEDPRNENDPAWQPPQTGNCDNVAAEVEALQAAHRHLVSRTGRTSTGVAKVPVNDCAILIDSYRHTPPAHSVREDISPYLMARYAIDDVKSFYIEAALSEGHPSSTQVHDWFWTQTCLGNTLSQLRQQWMNASEPKLKNLGEKFIVPHRWRTR